MLGKLPKLSFIKTKEQKNFDLPSDYVISKFYELGYKVSYNKYTNTYNSCCPLCNEGKSWGRKKRCFYVPENANIFCHNCGESLAPYTWIRRVSGMADRELWEDLENNCSSVDIKLDADEFVSREQNTLPEDCVNLFDPQQVSFYKGDHIIQTAMAYIRGRRLDTAFNKPDAIFVSRNDFFHKNRLILPFKDTNGKIIFYQTRKLFEWDDKPNYLSKFDADKSIFGMNNIDPSLDEVFIFEGPIDSCFVKNGIAVAGINEGNHRFTPTQFNQLEELKLFKKIWVLDNQWIDKTSREKTKILLDQGECVFIWPKKWGKFKDFNEICVKYEIDQISRSFVRENSLCGKGGALKFKVLFGKK